MTPPINSTPLTLPPSTKVHHSLGATQHDQLVHQTQRLVSQTFFGTMLKQMRESPFKSEVFSGGRGGQMFSELLDQHLAEHMARSSGTKLVNSIVNHIERAQHLDKSPRSKAKRSPKGINPSIQKGGGHVPAGLRA